MAEIPQLQDEQPILNPVSVNSSAQSYEDFAKTLGGLADTGEKVVEHMETAESKAMYMHSVANAQQVKEKAESLMLENPDQASTIAEKANESLTTLTKGAYVNDRDRSRLGYFAGNINNAIDLDATRTAVRQGQHQAAFTFYSNFPDQLKALQDASVSNPDEANQLHDSMVTSLSGMVKTGALTPEQAGNSIKAMGLIYQRAHDIHNLYNNSAAKAEDYHRVTSSPLNSGNENPEAPHNANTGWLTDYHNNDKSLQGVLADVYDRRQPSTEALMSLKPAEFQRATLAIQGAQVADGMINSGAPFTQIQKSYNDLTQKGEVLNYRDQATRAALGKYIGDLQSGNYLNVMTQTPQGNAIVKNFNDRNAAIQNSSVDDNKKYEMILENQNKFVNEAVSYGQAHHIPSEFIQPIAKSDIQTASNSFQQGQNPSTLLQTLGQYSKQNRLYVANAMPTPDQKMVVNAVSLSDQKIPIQDKLDFVAANQVGALPNGKPNEKERVFLDKDIKGYTKDNVMTTLIASNLKDAMDIVKNTYGVNDAQTLQRSMVATTLNYAKYLAQKAGDYGVSDYTKYVNQASQIYSNAFQKQSGSNWIVNSQQMPQPMTNKELDVLASYVTGEGYNKIRNSTNEVSFEKATSSNPLRMTISPQGNVQAIDMNNNVIYSTPFSTNLLALADKKLKESLEHTREIANKANVPGMFNAQPY